MHLLLLLLLLTAAKVAACNCVLRVAPCYSSYDLLLLGATAFGC